MPTKFKCDQAYVVSEKKLLDGHHSSASGELKISGVNLIIINSALVMFLQTNLAKRRKGIGTKV